MDFNLDEMSVEELDELLKKIQAKATRQSVMSTCPK